MKGFLKRRCPYCGNPGISMLTLFIFDVIGVSRFDSFPVKCSICSQKSAHPTWTKRAIVILLWFSLPLGYALSLKHHLHGYVNWTIYAILIFSFGISIAVSIQPINKPVVKLHGWAKIFLWIIWLGSVLIILFVALLSFGRLWPIPGGMIPLLLCLYGIVLWVTLDLLKQEIRAFSSESEKGDADS